MTKVVNPSALGWCQVAVPIVCCLSACPGQADRTPTRTEQAPTRTDPAPQAEEPKAAPEPAKNEDPLHTDPVQVSAQAGTVRIDPLGCGAVVVAFEPPEGFELDEAAGDAQWMRTHGPRKGLEIQIEKAWFDFVELDVTCAREPDSMQSLAAFTKQNGVDDAPEYPFAASADPQVQAMRQRIEVLTDSLDGPSPVLEYRNTFPDGVPAGFIYPKYVGYCWHLRADAGVVVEFRVNVPLERETEGRQWLRSLCAGLATARISPG